MSDTWTSIICLRLLFKEASIVEEYGDSEQNEEIDQDATVMVNEFDEANDQSNEYEAFRVVHGVDLSVLFENGRFKERSREIIKKIRNVMALVKRSTKVREDLRKHSILSPVMDVPTRWNSTFHMVKRFNKLQKPLQKAAIDSPKLSAKFDFTKNDLHICEALEFFLEPFDIATKKLSKRGVNLHQADLIFQMLFNTIQDEGIKELCKNRIKQRRQYW